MKKILLFLFAAPLYAMDKPSEDIQNNIPEQTISNPIQDTWTKSRKNAELICESALKLYNSQKKENPDFLFSISDVSTLIAKTYDAIKENKPKDALRWLVFFEHRAGLDFLSLGEKQRDAYSVLYNYLNHNVEAIQPENINKMHILWRANPFNNEADAWITRIVENDTCGNTEWRKILAPDDLTPNGKDISNLSLDTLKAERLKFVQTFMIKK